jgi:phosphoenolpyruvate carboxykinase (ATP)
MQAYILNTGSIGAKAGFAGEKITIPISTAIMKEIARETITWEDDPDWGYEVPRGVPGVELARYSPRRHYSGTEYAGLVAKLRQERRDWLARFPGLDPEISRAIEERA